MSICKTLSYLYSLVPLITPLSDGYSRLNMYIAESACMHIVTLTSQLSTDICVPIK